MNIQVTRGRLLDEVLRDRSPAGAAHPAPASGGAQIRIEVRENAHAYTLHAEMPGVRKEDIQVSLDGSTVLLRADILPLSAPGSEDRVLHNERPVGSITRSLQLPHAIDAERSHARFEQGLLTLTLPKRHLVGGQSIAIE